MADPTLEFLKRLEDPNLYVKVENVPVFKAHRRKVMRPDGTQVEIEVTEADLDAIADEAKRREREDGVLGRITIGHTNPKLPQTQQPPLVGYQRITGTGPSGPAGKKHVLACNYYKREQYGEVLDQYPFRSAEYFPDKRQIVGMAHLKTDPQLDMGMVANGRETGCIHYSLESNMAEPTEKPDANVPSDDAAEEKLTPEEEKMAEKFMRHYARTRKGMAEYASPCSEKPADYSGSNELRGKNQEGQLRAMNSDGTRGSNGDGGDYHPKNSSRDDDPVAYARLRGELARERTERLDYQRKLETEKCERIADQLQRGGYQFNREKFVQKIVGLDDAGRKAEIDDLTKYSRVDPTVNYEIPVVDQPVTPRGLPADVVPSDRETDLACQYMRDHECDDFDEALKHVRTGGKK